MDINLILTIISLIISCAGLIVGILSLFKIYSISKVVKNINSGRDTIINQ